MQVAEFEVEEWVRGADGVEHGPVRPHPGTGGDGERERHRAVGGGGERAMAAALVGLAIGLDAEGVVGVWCEPVDAQLDDAVLAWR